jgi:hypothetical protein
LRAFGGGFIGKLCPRQIAPACTATRPLAQIFRKYYNNTMLLASAGKKQNTPNGSRLKGCKKALTIFSQTLDYEYDLNAVSQHNKVRLRPLARSRLTIISPWMNSVSSTQ